MLTGLLGSIWRFLPGVLRRRLVRMGQRRFTVTVGALLLDDERRILLLEHVFRPDSGWGVPGGFINQGENPETALRRELREEIGVEIEDVRLVLARTLRRPRQVEIYFRARVIGQPVPCSFEIKRAQWFALDDLPDLSSDQRRLIKQTAGEKNHQ